MTRITPNFVVIGAQKAASTYVMQALSQHPEIFIYPRELPFFEDPDYGGSTFEKFCARFTAAKGKRVIGFKRPNYLAKAECPERICRHLPAAKLVAILRNPIERAVSAYFHYMTSGFIPIRPLNQGMADIIEGRYSGVFPASTDIIEYGFYAKHLQRYFCFFPTGSVLSVIFDDVEQSPGMTIQSIYRFLEVAEDFQHRTQAKRPMATTRSLTRLRIGTFMQSITTYYNEDRTRVYKRNSLFAKSVAMANGVFDKVILAKLFPDPRITLDPALRNRLADIYADDVQQLERLLGKTLKDRWLCRGRVSKGRDTV